MTRRSDAAFYALAGLDPVRRLPAEQDAAYQGAAVSRTDLSIARITALPRAEKARVVPPREPRRPVRSRHGALGLVASAGIAVIATLLWVSPSGGAPSNRMAGTPSAIGVGHIAGQTGIGSAP